MKKPIYYCQTKTRGRIEYYELPNSTYFAMGMNGSKEGEAYLFTFDNGTSLIPICYCETGKQVVNTNPKHEGVSVSELVRSEMILN